jgi:hypothetical protein
VGVLLIESKIGSKFVEHENVFAFLVIRVTRGWVVVCSPFGL